MCVAAQIKRDGLDTTPLAWDCNHLCGLSTF